MSQADQSFITIEAEKVREKCQETIARIEGVRERLDREFIENRMGSINWWIKWVLRWIGIKPIDFDEAKRIVDNDGSMSTVFSYPSHYAYGTLSLAKTMLRMCDTANDGLVRLTVEDYRQLFV